MDSIEEWFEHIYHMNAFEIKSNFQLVEVGSCRIVYGISDEYVIKLALDSEGFHQCKMENYVFNHADESLKEYLCPVIWYKPGMVVMPRAVPLTKITFLPYIEYEGIGSPQKVCQDLKRLSKKFNLLPEDIMSTTSWGIINNKPVLIDYGGTK